jgi:hypothetical protein
VHIQMAEGYFGVSFHLSVSIFNLSAVKLPFSYFTFVWHWTSCNLTTLMCQMSWKSGSLNLLEPSEPHQACYGTPLPFTFLLYLLFDMFYCSVHCLFYLALLILDFFTKLLVTIHDAYITEVANEHQQNAVSHH